jgi:hypothetical protein
LEVLRSNNSANNQKQIKEVCNPHKESDSSAGPDDGCGGAKSFPVKNCYFKANNNLVNEKPPISTASSQQVLRGVCVV